MARPAASVGRSTNADTAGSIWVPKIEPQVPAACVLWGRVAQRDLAWDFGPVRISRMFDAAAARRHMVDGQIRTADVTNLRLIAAMETVPREVFVPPLLATQAYLDGDIALGKGRALLRPRVLAKLIQGAGLR